MVAFFQAMKQRPKAHPLEHDTSHQQLEMSRATSQLSKGKK